MSFSRKDSWTAEDVPMTPDQDSRLADLFVTQAAWLRRSLVGRWGQRAEDIVQDVFLNLRQHPTVLNRILDPQALLLCMGQRIACNLYRGECRKARLHQAAQFLEGDGDSGEQAGWAESRHKLARAIRKLRGLRRVACARRFINGESIEVIAVKTKKGVRTIARWAESFLANFSGER